MSLLDNIKSNFLGNRNSFNVTFNNRNPLSYVGDASIPSHGSSIQTQMEAPAVEDVYKAHSPKEYLAAETKMHQAKGGAIGKLTSGLIAGIAGGEKGLNLDGAAGGKGFFNRFAAGAKEGVLKDFLPGDDDPTTDDELAEYKRLKAKFN